MRLKADSLHESAMLVDESFLIRSLSAIKEDALLSWTRHVEEPDVIKAGSKLLKTVRGRTPVSDSLVRCRERDKHSGNTRMTFWVTPDMLVIQSTA